MRRRNRIRRRLRISFSQFADKAKDPIKRLSQLLRSSPAAAEHSPVKWWYWWYWWWVDHPPWSPVAPAALPPDETTKVKLACMFSSFWQFTLLLPAKSAETLTKEIKCLTCELLRNCATLDQKLNYFSEKSTQTEAQTAPLPV